MVDRIKPIQIEDVHIVQLLGGVGPPEAKAHAMDITKRLSQLLNSRLSLLQVPGIVNNPEVRKVLLSDRSVGNVLQQFPKVNKAFVGIGAKSTNPVLQKENPEVSPKIQKEIFESKAVGDIGLNFFDEEGEIVETSFQELFIGMALMDLKKVKTVAGVAGGEEKYSAIKGALNGGYVNILITDQQTASKLAKE